MKRFYIIGCFGILAILFFDSCKAYKNGDSAGYVSSTKWVDRTEVTIADWITFITATTFNENNKKIYLNDSIGKVMNLLPDLRIQGWSNYVIKAFLRKDKKMVAYSIRNHCLNSIQKIYLPKTAWDSIKKFKLLELPVVGITNEQAIEYCKFKERMTNQCGLPYLRKRKDFYAYECYLPKPSQYDSLQNRMDSSGKCEYFNYKNALCIDCPRGEKYKLHPVLKNIGKEPIYAEYYWPNSVGLIGFKGNVAEMTSVEGIAKGGSCYHYASEAYEGKSQEYTKPEFWLGFRVWYRVYEK